MLNLCLQVGALEDAGRMDEAEALAQASVKGQLGDALRSIASDVPPPGGHALIIDGKALLHALGDDIKDSLLAVRPLPKSLHPGRYTPPALLRMSLLSRTVCLSFSGMVLLHALGDDITAAALRESTLQLHGQIARQPCLPASMPVFRHHHRAKETLWESRHALLAPCGLEIWIEISCQKLQR